MRKRTFEDLRLYPFVRACFFLEPFVRAGIPVPDALSEPTFEFLISFTWAVKSFMTPICLSSLERVRWIMARKSSMPSSFLLGCLKISCKSSDWTEQNHKWQTDTQNPTLWDMRFSIYKTRCSGTENLSFWMFWTRIWDMRYENGWRTYVSQRLHAGRGFHRLQLKLSIHEC